MDLKELIDEAMKLMPRDRMVSIDERVLTVVGDLHADLETFNVIKKKFEGKIIFLGDYADRGRYPAEVYSEVLKLFIEDKAIVLRGNHESTEVFPHDLPYYLQMSLGEEASEIYELLKKLWEKMPISAIVEGEAWFVHGGVPTKGKKVDKDEKISRKDIEKPDEQTKLEMLWNDPWEKDFCGDNYNRGFMYFFGRIATKKLLEALDVKVVIRSHEPYKVLRVEQDGMVVTVGSCAIPYGLAEAAILKINFDEGFKDGQDLVKKFGHVFSII